MSFEQQEARTQSLQTPEPAFFGARGPFHPQPSCGSVILMCCADTALPGTIFQSVSVVLVVSGGGDRKMESGSTAGGDVPESMLCTKHLLMVQ